jgi:hypothetical protein
VRWLLRGLALLSTLSRIAEGSPDDAPPEPATVALEQTSDSPASNTPEEANPAFRSWGVPILHGTALFVTLRLSEAYLYPDPFAETRWSIVGGHYEEAFTRPPKFDASKPWFEWDGDPWHINVVGHALMGSELYLRARTCGHGPLESLAFTAAGAVVWDYAFEGSGVRPSAFDLVYTPAAGIALGEFRHWVWSSSRSIEAPFFRGLVRGLFDPFGEVERWAGTPC